MELATSWDVNALTPELGNIGQTDRLSCVEDVLRTGLVYICPDFQELWLR